jgi:hypothetical protein
LLCAIAVVGSANLVAIGPAVPTHAAPAPYPEVTSRYPSDAIADATESGPDVAGI